MSIHQPSNLISNDQWVLTSYPKGLFNASKHASLTEATIDPSKLDPAEVVVQVEALSVDAFVRTMLRDDKNDSVHGNVKIGSPIPALGYGTIKYAGPNARFKPGQRVAGMLVAAEYATTNCNNISKMLSIPFTQPKDALGLFGISTGITAYVGVHYVAPKPPRRGETVVVSAATGGVGTIAAQLAKTTGARVVGIAGGPEKTKFLLDTLKLDGAVDYKSSTPLSEQLKETCPDGIDFYFDNVGGDVLDAVLEQINVGARIVICGAISQYSSERVSGPSNYLKLAERNASMSGFMVMQYMSKVPIAIIGLLWHKWRGNVFMPETIDGPGIEAFGPALQKLYEGGNTGKMLVDVSGDLLTETK